MPRPRRYICNITFAPKTQGILQRKRQKDCKNQRTQKYGEIVSPKNDGEASSSMQQYGYLHRTQTITTLINIQTWKEGGCLKELTLRQNYRQLRTAESGRVSVLNQFLSLLPSLPPLLPPSLPPSIPPSPPPPPRVCTTIIKEKEVMDFKREQQRKREALEGERERGR